MKELPFVGRENELAELMRYFERTLAGNGQVCFVTGQAGSGKSALVRHFLQQVVANHPSVVAAVGSCNSQTGIGDPYLPFREALAMLTGDPSVGQAAIESAPEMAGRLRTILARSVQVLVEVAPELVGVFIPGVKLLGHLGKALVNNTSWGDKLEQLAEKEALTAGAVAPPSEQSRIFEQYTAFVQELSEAAPLLLFFDDLQWADNASLNLFFHLARRLEKSRVLLLGAYRPNDIVLGREMHLENTRSWTRHLLEPTVLELTRYFGDITIDLDEIPAEDSRRFVDALLDVEPNQLHPLFRDALFRQTGGHALFTVELVRSMQEDGRLARNAVGRWVESPTLDWSKLPARVEGVVAERLARLDEELREILTVGSIEGEEFTAEVVARVEQLAERDVIRQCNSKLQRQHQLVSAQGMVRRGPRRLSLYRFVHNLFQQYLYSNLGEAERLYLHRDVGEALETLFADEQDVVAAQLAHHFAIAGIVEKAVAYCLQAGKRARRMSAHDEAITHFKRGLQLLADLPPGVEQMRLELGLQTALGTELILTQGYASPSVEQAYDRAREICRLLGDPPEVIPVLYGLCAYSFVRGELQQTYAEAQQVLALASQANDLGYLLGAQQLLGATAMHLGQLERARQHLEAVLNQYQVSQHAELAYSQGHDPAVSALSFLAFTLWQLGYPEQALSRTEQALALAQELNHPYTTGFAASFAAMLLQMLRRWPDSQAQAELALQAGKHGGFPLWQAIGAMIHGLAVVQQGRSDEGVAELAQGIAIWEATGARLSLPYQRTLLAEAYSLVGRRTEGLRALTPPIVCTDELFWCPEAHRVQAELLLLAPGAEADAEAGLRRAYALANGQQAKALELRAAMSLARLLHRQGRSAEGRALVAASYHWFREGFNTADLVDAAALLRTLGSQIVPAVAAA